MDNEPKLADMLKSNGLPYISGNDHIYKIINERYRHPGNQAKQDELAIADHQAFARQVMLDSPKWRKPINALGLAVAIPGYEALKSLGITERDQYTSRPSLASILAGYRGLGQGIARSF
jgi:hypothetical protein